MGCFDGTEICELVGSFILNKLYNVLFKENVCLYRYDGLAALKSTSGPGT